MIKYIKYPCKKCLLKNTCTKTCKKVVRTVREYIDEIKKYRDSEKNICPCCGDVMHTEYRQSIASTITYYNCNNCWFSFNDSWCGENI